MLKMIKKSFFNAKMFVWIKEDRDSVTRPKNENIEKIEKNKKIGFRLRCASFFHCLQDFVHTLIIKHD